MKLDTNLKDVVLHDSFGGTMAVYPLADPYNILTKKFGYSYRRVDDHSIHISEENIKELFEPIENFTAIGFNKSKNKFDAGYTFYKFNSFDIIIEVSKVNNESKYRIWNIYSKLNPSDDYDDLLSEFNSSLILTNHANQIKILLLTDKGISFKPFTIKPKPIDIDKMYNDDFKCVHEHLVDKLNGDDKGIILLHGDAGAGKTNYIKNLTNFVPNKTFVFVAPEFIGELTSPKFIESLIENKNSVLVLEDSENFMKDRNSTTSSTNIISTLLNISDGILSDILNIQIICTFNTQIQDIDEALKRKGRLIAEYHFKKLTKEKVKVLFDEYEINEEPKEMVLTEIFNREQSYKTEKKQTKLGLI